MNCFEKDLSMAKAIAEKVAEFGGRVYFVGGYVRDRLMNIENKDIDIEVHGVSPDVLESILDGLGKRMTMGQSFGIYGLKGYGLDVAMPRKEHAIGRGHRDFQVSVDPYIGTFKAAMRRDFTINALMQDVLSGEIIDHFSGLEDIKNGVIRHVSDESFAEDPLRVLRAAQFSARFNFEVAHETVLLCEAIDLGTLSKERVLGEMFKALSKADKPSHFFRTLEKMNQLSHWFPELEALIGIKQDTIHHPEGDAYTHTLMVLDEAAKYRDKAGNPNGFMLSALCHDFGKSVSTEIIDGRIHSYMHEIKGLALIKTFLKRLTNESSLIQYVLNMCEHHMKPNILANDRSAVKSTNRMFDSVSHPRDLIYLSVCDRLGKNENDGYSEFLFERLELYDQMMARPFVSGKDLIDSGLTPDETFSEILAYAHKLRLAGVDKPAALKQTLSYANKIKK